MSTVATTDEVNVETPPPSVEDKNAKILHDRIEFILSVYPGISAIMIQMALGPSTRSQHWRPVLQEMQKNGEVRHELVLAFTPRGQHRSYSKYYLNKPLDVTIDRSIVESELKT
jgi:hypothetical protein